MKKIVLGIVFTLSVVVGLNLQNENSSVPSVKPTVEGAVVSKTSCPKLANDGIESDYLINGGASLRCNW